MKLKNGLVFRLEYFDVLLDGCLKCIVSVPRTQQAYQLFVL